jgi:hypothetical protein
VSYVPPPPPPTPVQGPSPGPPPAHPTRDLWLGILVGVLATLLAPALAVFLAGYAGSWLGLLGLFAPLAVLVAGIVLAFIPSTRRWGVGLLIGFSASLIVGAGACVVLLSSLSSGAG